MASRRMQTKGPSFEFIPLHITPFEENGVWFAKAEEFQIVAHGESETEAARNVYNKVLRAVFVALKEGRLPAILKKAGVEIKLGVPEEDVTLTGQKDLWFLPIAHRADHLSLP